MKPFKCSLLKKHSAFSETTLLDQDILVCFFVPNLTVAPAYGGLTSALRNYLASGCIKAGQLHETNSTSLQLWPKSENSEAKKLTRTNWIIFEKQSKSKSNIFQLSDRVAPLCILPSKKMLTRMESALTGHWQHSEAGKTIVSKTLCDLWTWAQSKIVEGTTRGGE